MRARTPPPHRLIVRCAGDPRVLLGQLGRALKSRNDASVQSSPGGVALALDDAGADALVRFNRFLQPDIDPEELVVLPRVNLSSPSEGRLPRSWIALLRRRVRASLAAATGVEVPADVASDPLAGADVNDHLGPAAPRAPVFRRA